MKGWNSFIKTNLKQLLQDGLQNLSMGGSFEYVPRTGAPCFSVNAQTIQLMEDIVMDKRTISQREIADILGISKGVIKNSPSASQHEQGFNQMGSNNFDSSNDMKSSRLLKGALTFVLRNFQLF